MSKKPNSVRHHPKASIISHQNKENKNLQVSNSNSFQRQQSDLCLESNCKKSEFQLQCISNNSEALDKIIQNIPFMTEYSESKVKPIKNNPINQIEQFPSRDLQVLQRKNMTNHKYLIAQTKQLLCLTHLLNLNEEIKAQKQIIMETKIKINHEKIRSRSKSRKLSSLRTFKPLRCQTSIYSSDVSCSEVYEIKEEEIKMLMKKRLNLLKDSIKTRQQYLKTIQQQIIQENNLIRQQISTTDKAAQNKTRSLLSLSKSINTPQRKGKKSMSLSKNNLYRQLDRHFIKKEIPKKQIARQIPELKNEYYIL